MFSIHQRMIRRLTATLLMMVSSGSALQAQETTRENPGIAIVTSVEGTTLLSDETVTLTPFSLHETLHLSGQLITTKQDAYLLLACSNGLGIGIDSETEVRFIDYTQTPFNEERAALDFEPSTSVIDIELKSGAINLSTKGLSPRSNIRVKTPHGTVRVHSANCRVELSELGTSILTFGGNATFYYANGDKREFISKFGGIRISSQSAASTEIAEIIDSAEMDPQKQAFAEATLHASNRVHFKAPEPGKPAAPMLIIPSAYFEVPSARPYEYSE